MQAVRCKRMRTAKFKMSTLTATVILAAIISFHSGISLIMVNYTIHSSGSIGIPITRPLHTEGKYIKDEDGNIVFLRGIWKGGLIDTCAGWWTPPGMDISSLEGYGIWREDALRAWFEDMKNRGFNIYGDFIWGDWWLQDASTSIAGYATDISYRNALRETLRIAQEYGLYVQFRLYSPAQTEGRKEFPYNTGESVCSQVWTAEDFKNFWVNVATELKGYPNVMFCIFDEPITLYQTTPDPISGKSWFDVAEETIDAMRAVGFDGLIVLQWGYCGDCYWMEKWYNLGKPTQNIAFSQHIYRYHGTYDGIGRSTDLDTIRNFIYANQQPTEPYPATGLHYNRIANELNLPILVALGAFNGAVDDDEYTSFVNTLTVLNELELGYYAFVWHRSDMVWALQQHTVAIQPLNRIGQALKDAVAAGTT